MQFVQLLAPFFSGNVGDCGGVKSVKTDITDLVPADVLSR